MHATAALVILLYILLFLPELAYQYAKEGACLALVARRKQALKSVAAAALERGAPDVFVFPADVTDPDQSRRAVEETVAHFGKLDHLVANAGIWSSCFFDQVTNITAFTKLMDVNFWGSVYPTYYALPHLKASSGKLVVSCSAAGTVATSRMAFYNASKAAGLRFYETLRAELGSEVDRHHHTHGYVESEITKGKGMSRAPYKQEATRGSRPLGQRILEATGAKRLFPPSLLHPVVKTE
uniref:Uncharacterized protein n=1 Tax=Setaria viridis TaxID=4556 RepID=A0A4U6SVF9_SETVI|nr:LOW QUALITY PROTEIN: hypothetical protein SEVIR_9G179200v2 [Setaria viridis]